MRKILIFTVLAFFSIAENKICFAEEINVNQIFTSDTVFNPFSSQEITYTLKISGPLRLEQNQQVIDLSAYPNGLYLINLYVNENLIATEKLSKGLK